MNDPFPHFLLFPEARRRNCLEAEAVVGEWRFVLESIDGAARFEAADLEAGMKDDRLNLLAVVRGLEALDQPSRVTLVTSSRYVSRGIREYLVNWRDDGWQWESYGQMTPVTDCDLWRRVDRAMRFHRIECRTWRFDPPHDSSPAPNPATQPDAEFQPPERTQTLAAPNFARHRGGRRRGVMDRLRGWVAAG